MKLHPVFAISTLTAALVACGGGDINIDAGNQTPNAGTPQSSTSSSSSSSAPAVSNCASYTQNNQTYKGLEDGNNCFYPSTFASSNREITQDLTFNALPNGGVHVLSGSLFIGADVSPEAAKAGTPVLKNGAGASITLNAGAKLAFEKPEDYLRIARGSQIFANGTKAAPVIVSASQDLLDGTATENDRGLWGGIQILGNGLTNKCEDATNCHLISEGQPGTYGGNDNSESSGSMQYLIVKHAGYEVVDGNELNGITFYGVGSGTVVENVQVYTTKDDGFEMFGGAVNLKRVIAVNVGDDSYDFADGWVGNIQFALALQTSGSNRCIEADNTGSDRADNIEPLTFGRIANHTCITSNVKEGQGSEPSSKGDAEGPLFREGAQFALYNSLITSNADNQASQECFELDDTEGPETIKFIKDEISVAQGNIIACSEAVKKGKQHADNASFDAKAWLVADNKNLVIDAAQTGALPVSLLKDFATNKRAYLTAAAFEDGNKNPVTVALFDVSTLPEVIDTKAKMVPVATGSNSFFEKVNYVGAVSADDDWTAGWAIGLTQPN